jgi:hypothetical protein
LRRWVIGLDPENMHQEILQRLGARWTVVRDAFLYRDSAADPNSTFPSLTQFLERITIDDRRIELNGYHLSLLALLQADRLIWRRQDPTDPRVFYIGDPGIWADSDSIELTGENFVKRFYREWVLGIPQHEQSFLTEYEQLLGALQQLRTAHPQPPRRDVLYSLLARQSTVKIAGQLYRVPTNWRDKLSGTPAPGEVARLLLSQRWHRGARSVKELLVRLRAESPIAAAWTAYGEWLGQEPTKLGDLYLVICRHPVLLRWPTSWPAVNSPR